MAQVSRSDGVTFDQVDFVDQFGGDLRAARLSIIVQSAFLSVQRIEKFAIVLAQKINSGVRVCAFIQEPSDWPRRGVVGSLDVVTIGRLRVFEASVEMLQSLGVHVNLRQRIHAKVAVVDHSILWDGSLNILSFNGMTDERMTRWCDAEKAIAAIEMHKLDQCDHCSKPSAATITCEIVCSKDVVGSMIVRQRKLLKISQKELARTVDISRSCLSGLESGRILPSMSVFLKISTALGRSVTWLPPLVVPTVQRIVDIEQSQQK